MLIDPERSTSVSPGEAMVMAPLGAKLVPRAPGTSNVPPLTALARYRFRFSRSVVVPAGRRHMTPPPPDPVQRSSR